jgi:hypothetical protein
MRHRWVRTALLLVAGVALGSLREFLFVNVNYQIDHVARATPFSYAHSAFQGWVAGWGTRPLFTLKWSMAIGFIVAMWSLCMLLLRTYSAPRRLLALVSVLFVLIPAGALLLHLLAYRAPLAEEASVNLLHAVQTPIVLVFLWVTLALFKPANGPGD